MSPELEKNLRTVSDPRALVNVFGWNDPPPRHVMAMPDLWKQWAERRKDKCAINVLCTTVNGKPAIMHFEALK
jgi:hypothetical protein